MDLGSGMNKRFHYNRGKIPPSNVDFIGMLTQCGQNLLGVSLFRNAGTMQVL